MRQAPPRPDGATGGDTGLLDPDRKTIFTVFQELGLKLESQRAVVDMFIIDHVEPPAAN